MGYSAEQLARWVADRTDVNVCTRQCVTIYTLDWIKTHNDLVSIQCHYHFNNVFGNIL